MLCVGSVCCGEIAYRWPVRSPDSSLAPATVCPTAMARQPRDMRKSLCHLKYNVNLDKYFSQFNILKKYKSYFFYFIIAN